MRLAIVAVITIICFSLSGCAILSIPLKLVGAAMGLAGKAMDLAKELPMPPPGVF